VPRKSGNSCLILMLGAAQLLFLDVPAHAAIDLSVQLAKRDANATHFSGLVNAVLRKIAGAGREKLAGSDGPRLNTPDWLWSRWSKAYGTETAHAIAAAHMVEPAVDLTVAKDAADWAERLGGTLLPTGSIRLAKAQGAVEQLPGFEDGAWWVQDAAAAMPARLLGALTGKSVADLCAAPGGKTLQLCAAGADVTAVDSSAQRLERLHGNLRRARFEAEVIAADVLDFAPPNQFDAVMLDAPCSATGTIRRHPDLAYLKTAAQTAALVALQARLLANAAALVRPGGQLIYCTCSLEPQEGERQIAAFLAGTDRFAIAPISPGECGIESHMITGQGTLRTLPFMSIGGVSGLDGFFAARLTRSL
jgi:16S rRNA (cytosine967-C5)-methyltransferase